MASSKIETVEFGYFKPGDELVKVEVVNLKTGEIKIRKVKKREFLKSQRCYSPKESENNKAETS